MFANESELKSLYETSDFDTAAQALRSDAKLAVVTRSEKGCAVLVQERHPDGAGGAHRARWWTPPAPATCSRPASCSALRAATIHVTAAKLGSLAAAEVIQHIGARPEVSLKSLAQQNGLPV